MGRELSPGGDWAHSARSTVRANAQGVGAILGAQRLPPLPLQCLYIKVVAITAEGATLEQRLRSSHAHHSKTGWCCLEVVIEKVNQQRKGN